MVAMVRRKAEVATEVVVRAMGVAVRAARAAATRVVVATAVVAMEVARAGDGGGGADGKGGGGSEGGGEGAVIAVYSSVVCTAAVFEIVSMPTHEPNVATSAASIAVLASDTAPGTAELIWWSTRMLAADR